MRVAVGAVVVAEVAVEVAVEVVAAAVAVAVEVVEDSPDEHGNRENMSARAICASVAAASMARDRAMQPSVCPLLSEKIRWV